VRLHELVERCILHPTCPAGKCASKLREEFQKHSEEMGESIKEARS
jgi:hypothetical protein